MPKPTIIYYSVLKYQPENIKKLNEYFNVLELPNPDHDNSEAFSVADVILAPLGFFCGKEKIDAMPKLKVIGSNTTGHPHIDVEYANKKGIKVVTLKNETEFLKSITPTAELTWGLIIALTRNIIPAYNSVLQGNWDRRPFGGRAMLSKMSLGIVGMGRLGQMVGTYGRCFNMKVSYFDPYVNLRDNMIHKIGTLKELVESNDIITIHVPHEPKTENLFDKEVFGQVKRGAYLINTSRGELVDKIALLDCLKKGYLAGAAIDVFPNEFTSDFQIKNDPLWQYAQTHNNLIITPHIGGSTYDAWMLTERRVIDKINEIIA